MQHLHMRSPYPVPYQVSRFQFVDMPGAERLAMEPELLRLREGGQLSRSLLSFASVLRELADAGAAGIGGYGRAVQGGGGQKEMGLDSSGTKAGGEGWGRASKGR